MLFCFCMFRSVREILLEMILDVERKKAKEELMKEIISQDSLYLSVLICSHVIKFALTVRNVYCLKIGGNCFSKFGCS